MKAFDILPDLGTDRRFGAVSFGYDRIITLREEFSALAALAARVSGVPIPDLTVDAVQRAQGQYDDRVNALTCAFDTLKSRTSEADPVLDELGVVLSKMAPPAPAA
jgi:hypothetical protein